MRKYLFYLYYSYLSKRCKLLKFVKLKITLILLKLFQLFYCWLKREKVLLISMRNYFRWNKIQKNVRRFIGLWIESNITSLLNAHMWLIYRYVFVKERMKPYVYRVLCTYGLYKKKRNKSRGSCTRDSHH